MQKRRKNIVKTLGDVTEESVKIITLADAKALFLRDIRVLAKQTQRWHR
jgi:hypothetical protein